MCPDVYFNLALLFSLFFFSCLQWSQPSVRTASADWRLSKEAQSTGAQGNKRHAAGDGRQDEGQGGRRGGTVVRAPRGHWRAIVRCSLPSARRVAWPGDHPFSHSSDSRKEGGALT
jgi:hypothetical protein